MDCTQNEADDSWTCTKTADEPRPWTELGDFTVTDDEYQRMKAQIHNDAAGWDAPENVAKANERAGRPDADLRQLHQGGAGRRDAATSLPIGVGHAGDYNGYTVCYREYRAGTTTASR